MNGKGSWPSRNNYGEKFRSNFDNIVWNKKIMQKPQIIDDLGIGGCFNFEKDFWIFEDTINRVNPKEILETGFFQGLSSLILLNYSKANLTSVDPMVNLYSPNTKHDGKIENVQKLKDAFPNRFTFLQKDSKLVRPDLKDKKFDLFHIDGDHWPAGISNDFQLAIDLKIPYCLVDDFVTDVERVYNAKFSNFFKVIKIYDRADHFLGKPIPMYLLQTRL